MHSFIRPFSGPIHAPCAPFIWANNNFLNTFCVCAPYWEILNPNPISVKESFPPTKLLHLGRLCHRFYKLRLPMLSDIPQ